MTVTKASISKVTTTLQEIDQEVSGRPPTPADWAAYDDTPLTYEEIVGAFIEGGIDDPDIGEYVGDWEHLLLRADIIEEEQIQRSATPFFDLWVNVLDIWEQRHRSSFDEESVPNPTLYEVCDITGTDPNDYAVYYDSWTAVLTGVLSDTKSRKCSDLSREELLREALRVCHRPTENTDSGELTQTALMNSALYSYSPYAEEFDGMDEIRHEVGVEDPNTNIRGKLLDDLCRVAEEIGHPPSTVDVAEHGEYAYSTYLGQDEWDTWEDVMEAADFDAE